MDTLGYDRFHRLLLYRKGYAGQHTPTFESSRSRAPLNNHRAKFPVEPYGLF